MISGAHPSTGRAVKPLCANGKGFTRMLEVLAGVVRVLREADMDQVDMARRRKRRGGDNHTLIDLQLQLSARQIENGELCVENKPQGRLNA